MQVAVYGTLRKGQKNNPILSDSKYLGSFESDPNYIMCSISDNFPAIKVDGDTSVYFEVYSVNKYVLSRLDQLEGYIGHKDKDNHYNRKIINTPWGKCMTYVYNSNFSKLNKKISSGNWVEYLQQQKIKNYA